MVRLPSSSIRNTDGALFCRMSVYLSFVGSVDPDDVKSAELVSHPVNASTASMLLAVTLPLTFTFPLKVTPPSKVPLKVPGGPGGPSGPGSPLVPTQASNEASATVPTNVRCMSTPRTRPRRGTHCRASVTDSCPCKRSSERLKPDGRMRIQSADAGGRSHGHHQVLQLVRLQASGRPCGGRTEGEA